MNQLFFLAVAKCSLSHRIRVCGRMSAHQTVPHSPRGTTFQTVIVPWEVHPTLARVHRLLAGHGHRHHSAVHTSATRIRGGTSLLMAFDFSTTGRGEGGGVQILLKPDQRCCVPYRTCAGEGR